ncbi:MAG: hypothetical protein ACT4PJ_10625 [Gemmatimonadaceae bacterium]
MEIERVARTNRVLRGAPLGGGRLRERASARADEAFRIERPVCLLRSAPREIAVGEGLRHRHSFYGSAWLLVRWAIDQLAPVEAGFLRGLTQDHARTGIANLEARAGRTWAEMIPEWSLALALDDHPAEPPVGPRLSIPSLNTRDIFAGMASDFPSTYAASFPLAMVKHSFGGFASDLTITAGSSAFLELSGTQSARQLIEVRTRSGATPPSHVRVSVVRLQ